MNLREALVFWNPWWTEATQRLPVADRRARRELTGLMKRKEILCLSGVRRCGKSTVLRLLIDELLDQGAPPVNILHLNLEDPVFKGLSVFALYEKYLEFMNPTGSLYLFFDEIQGAEDWQLDIRKLYDGVPNVKMVLTGSNSSLLKGEYATHLTGRTLIYEMYPFDFKEAALIKGVLSSFEPPALLKNKPRLLHLFAEYMEYGGFPEVVQEGDRKLKNLLLKEYYLSILFRDVLRRYAIRQSRKYEEAAHYFLSNIAGLFSAKRIAALLNISMHTLEDYLCFLEDFYLFFPVNHFSFSVKRQITSPRKIYTVDNGFLSAVSFRFSEDAGKKLENLVFGELKRYGRPIYYWKGKKECDFIIADDRAGFQAIQVCYALTDPQTKKRELNGLSEALQAINAEKGLILTYDEFEDLNHQGKTIEVRPVWHWLLTAE